MSPRSPARLRNFAERVYVSRCGGRFLDRDQFVNAIAPKGDLTRISRTQFAILFRVADAAKRGLLSWDDFVVFQALLKRPDADYYMAFQYFDVYARVRTLRQV
jgi:solute carrier family 25 aspartate/glutamate transporter 12/13